MAPWRRADGSIGGALLFSEHRTEQVEARHALADSEARFRATFENAAVGVAMVARDGSILRANNSFARMLGYSIEELMVRTFQDLTHPTISRAICRYATRRLSAKPTATASRSAMSARTAASFGLFSQSAACGRRMVASTISSP
jgi:PAS domain-containing protein